MTAGNTRVNRGHAGRTSRGAGRKMTVLTVLLFLIVVTGTGFNFGLSPASADKGVRAPGEQFFVSFYLVTQETNPVDVGIDVNDADINTVSDDRQHNFSEQFCGDCVEFLNAGGRMENEGATGDIEQWKNIEFFVNVPEHAEPGYHALEVTPQPQRSGGGGGVEVISSVSFPVTYRVPGKAIRDGEILGVHAGRNMNGRQRIITTFHNTGTVTMEVDGAVTVNTTDGNQTIRAGTKTVQPGETARFTAYVDTDDLAGYTDTDNTGPVQDTFTVYASADYSTGDTRYATSLRPTEPVTVQAAAVQEDTAGRVWSTYALLFVLLILSTLTTWKVVTYART